MEERVKGFLDGIKKLNEKFKLDITAKLQIDENGVKPVPALVDLDPKPNLPPEEKKVPKVIKP